MDCIDSTFVSSVGAYVDNFETALAQKVASRYAVACVNGTSALHIALLLADIGRDDLVITQPLTFVATCNAISYTGAKPVFIDVDQETMGLSPKALRTFLEANCIMRDDQCVHRATDKIIKACMPMHTFGHPCQIDEIANIAKQWRLVLIEDAAESLGSYHKDRHTGTFGAMGIFSFNGNKIITAGAGGAIVTDDEMLAKRAKHLSTTAKEPHSFEYIHNEVGYNYRMPNLNAALLLAQLEQLDVFLEQKRKLYDLYKVFFDDYDAVLLCCESKDTRANYWLQAVVLDSKKQRDEFLQYTNANAVMTRPVWQLMNTLPMFSDCLRGDLTNAKDLANRVVNLPSSVLVA